MAGIQEYLYKIKNAVYGREVRQAIHDGIHQCYEDGKAGAVDLVAREEIAELIAPSGEAPSAAEVTDARIGADGTTYASLGLANRTQFSDLKSDLNQNVRDLLSKYTIETVTWKGITLTHNTDGTYTFSGTATGANFFDNFFYNVSAFPDGIVAGSTYLVKYSATDVKFQVMWFKDTTTAVRAITFTDNGLFTIPSDATGICFRFFIANGTTVNEIVEQPKVLSLGELYDIGAYRPNAKMLSIGNSILTGSVWTNGSFNHLVDYPNSPYGNIATGLGISESNVRHKLVSSTGLMYDAGEGSFLSHIRTTNLDRYDYLLTHLYYKDMTSDVSTGIGSLESSAGDGTIAGAVLELLDYIKTSNPDCKLILISVPPSGTNTSEYGVKVFERYHSNGYNIVELDYLLHRMAKQYHFLFADWEDWTVSYHWKEFTDNNNIHLNNDETYRAEGEYLSNAVLAQNGFGVYVSPQKAVFTEIEGRYLTPYGTGGVSENWCNTGYVDIADFANYIKVLNGSAGGGLYSAFFDADFNMISADTTTTSGEYSAERLLTIPDGAKYIRCNYTVSNRDKFGIYWMLSDSPVESSIAEHSLQEFHAVTGNKLTTPFSHIKSAGALFTITDDDTTSLLNVQRFHDVCADSEIRGCYAVMTKNTEADPNIVTELLGYEKEGFQNVVHCHYQRAIYKPAPDRDIDACREDLATAIQNMQKYGFSDYRHWVSPYGVMDTEMRDLARDFGFDCLITVPTASYCRFNPYGNFGLYAMPRMELYPDDVSASNGNTLSYIKSQMLDCANNGGWFHLCTHMYQWGDDLSRITEVLQYAKELGMKNVTISGGLSYWRDVYKMYDLF